MVRVGLNRLLARLPWSSRKYRITNIAEAADEIPDQLPRRGVTIVGTKDAPTWVAFDCPCFEHHRVMLNLDSRRRPAWRVIARSPLSIHPSIDELRAGVRCHYFIKGGRVHWAYNSDGKDS